MRSTWRFRGQDRSDQESANGTQGGRFVIQEHYARSHHFDLRLERDGVLVSWAVPKGMPTDPTADRLAVAVLDHSLDHLDVEDVRPVDGGPPGAVVKRIWDQGHYSVRPGDDPADKIVFTLDGERLCATYALIRTHGDNWLLHLMHDS
jgi:bifunctional non-homologous end joining protein LigD